MAERDIREEVRQRYAAAGTAVSTTGAERGSFVGCIAGALSRAEYLTGLSAVGFEDPEVRFTHEAAPGMHGAIVRARKPL